MKYLFIDREIQLQRYCFLICILIWGIISVGIAKNGKLLKIDILTVVICFFICYLIVVFLYSHVRITLLYLLEFIILYFLCRLIQKENIWFFNIIIVLTCLIQAIFGLLQYMGIFYSYSPFPIVGSFDNPAGFAVCLTVGIPFCIELTKSETRLKYFTYFSMLIISTAVILSGARVGIISIFIVIGLFIYNKYIKLLQKTQKKRLRSVVMIVFGILIIVLFFIKKDSAMGRLLIWKATCTMINDASIFGLGNGSFLAEYMLYQAEYLKNNPDSGFKELSNNVLHPFNEYLLLIIEYGIVGIILCFTVIYVIFRYNKKEFTLYLLVIIVLSIFACFSYPLRYPFIWVILAYSLAQLSHNVPVIYTLKNVFNPVIKITIIGSFLLCSYLVYKDIQFEYKWKNISKLSLLGATKYVIPEYKKLYDNWNGNPFFLYNYGAELNHVGAYTESAVALHYCEIYFNDYDVQMILADNYLKLKKYNKAEFYYKEAAAMCPSRFKPLYQLTTIYDELGQHDKSFQLAKVILEKKVKIPSITISRIKTEMQKKINEYDPHK